MSFQLKNVVVIGAGTMGSGIAQWFAQQGLKVSLTDAHEEQLQKAKNNIHSSWEKLQKKGKFKESEIKCFTNNLTFVEISAIDENTDLVIEAIFENLEIKKQLFTELDQKLHKNAIIASNTSSFPICTLAKDLSEGRKRNFLGLHFFNPAPIMKLVEVISSSWTDCRVAKNLYDWFDQNGKKPAHCKDSPGFIVNRVARNFYGEALRIVGSDNKDSYKEIDNILKEVAGFKMGPFELMDHIGIDINYQVTCSVWQAYFNEPRFAPHQLQKQMVDSGRLGKKTKAGFYSYE